MILKPVEPKHDNWCLRECERIGITAGGGNPELPDFTIRQPQNFHSEMTSMQTVTRYEKSVDFKEAAVEDEEVFRNVLKYILENREDLREGGYFFDDIDFTGSIDELYDICTKGNPFIVKFVVRGKIAAINFKNAPGGRDHWAVLAFKVNDDKTVDLDNQVISGSGGCF